MKNKKIVFSAIRPTGNLTIGNYLGVIHQWLQMQKNFNCFFCIADLYSLNKIKLKEKILNTLSLYLACGIDYKKNKIFLQSQISEHYKMFWILNYYVNYNDLKKMIQFKENYKICKNVNNYIFNYPILMASDILLYNTDLVCIGFDQKQHLELINKIIKKFNNIHLDNFFKIPKLIVSKLSNKILSLQDIEKKMSKSDKNSNNLISLLDSRKSIKKKIYLSKTDSDFPPLIKFDLLNKPGISNLLIILSIIEKKKIYFLEYIFKNKNYFYFKKKVYKSLIKFIKNIKNKYKYYRKKKKLLYKILKNGKKIAKMYSSVKLKEIYNLVFNKKNTKL